jgi:hypothetical protein
LIAVTLIGPVPTIDRVAFDRHLAREAAVHAVVAQQVRVGLDRAEIVDGDDLDVVRPDSTMARRMLRPMRPNPLMATFTAMLRSLLRASAGRPRRTTLHGGAGGHGFGRDAEMLVEFLVGRAGAEAGHADEGAVRRR